jgi:hypothetical protein
MRKHNFTIEVTDTYGGEANYAWVKRLKVVATTARGAVRMVSKDTGFKFRLSWFDGETWRYDAKNACICLFINHETF